MRWIRWKLCIRLDTDIFWQKYAIFLSIFWRSLFKNAKSSWKFQLIAVMALKQDSGVIFSPWKMWRIFTLKQQIIISTKKPRTSRVFRFFLVFFFILLLDHFLFMRINALKHYEVKVNIKKHFRGKVYQVKWSVALPRKWRIIYSTCYLCLTFNYRFLFLLPMLQMSFK